MAVLIGLAVSVLLPSSFQWITRGLTGWNVAVWLYLVLVGLMMRRAEHMRLRRIAAAQAQGASTVLAIVILAALVSMLGMVAELSAAKVPGTAHALPHVAFAIITVVGAWLLVPVVFALTYASVYFKLPDGSGLRFVDENPAFKPDYVDFLYFSFTLAVASQTSDVVVSSQAMRRLVLLHSVVSFVFNTAILAFTINIAASLF